MTMRLAGVSVGVVEAVSVCVTVGGCAGGVSVTVIAGGRKGVDVGGIEIEVFIGSAGIDPQAEEPTDKIKRIHIIDPVRIPMTPKCLFILSIPHPVVHAD
jgi:hypothetical protein